MLRKYSFNEAIEPRSQQTSNMQIKANKSLVSMNFNTYLVAHAQFNKFISNRIMIVDDEEFCLSSMKVVL